MHDELKELYEDQLKPQLIGIENQRKSIKKLWIAGLVVFVSFCILLPAILSFGILGVVCIVLGLLATMILFGISIVKFFLYRKTFKQEVVSKVFHIINPSYHYDADSHIDISVFNDSKLFSKKPDRCFGDDFIRGVIDKTDFEFSELKAAIRHTTTENGKTSESWKPVFEGLFFHADFNKHIEGTTLVLPDIAEKLLGNVAHKFQKESKRGELVKLENPAFEKEFKVYSTGQQQARYILTPAMMEAMVNIKMKFNRNMHFSFTGERVYCGIEYKQGLFEPRIFKSGANYTDIEEMYQLFRFIEIIIREMNLNTRIWTKE